MKLWRSSIPCPECKAELPACSFRAPPENCPHCGWQAKVRGIGLGETLLDWVYWSLAGVFAVGLGTWGAMAGHILGPQLGMPGLNIQLAILLGLDGVFVADCVRKRLFGDATKSWLSEFLDDPIRLTLVSIAITVLIHPWPWSPLLGLANGALCLAIKWAICRDFADQREGEFDRLLKSPSDDAADRANA